MDLETLRFTLKALANDTRLRMFNLLNQRELTVTDICAILGVSQPTASKQLMRLLLLKILTSKRDGNFVYYKLDGSSEYGRIIQFIISASDDLEVFKNDKERLVNLKSRTRKPKKEEKPAVDKNHQTETAS
jgi:DNA-binding transcriptional ArsR family regulator